MGMMEQQPEDGAKAAGGDDSVRGLTHLKAISIRPIARDRIRGHGAPQRQVFDAGSSWSWEVMVGLRPVTAKGGFSGRDGVKLDMAVKGATGATQGWA